MAPSRGSLGQKLLWCLRGSNSGSLDSPDSSPTGKSSGPPDEEWNRERLHGTLTASSSSGEGGERCITGQKAWATPAAAEGASTAANKRHGLQGGTGTPKGNRVAPLGAGGKPSAGMQAASTALALVTGAGGRGSAEPVSLRTRRPSNLPGDLISAIDSFAESTVHPHGSRQLTAEELQGRGLKLFYPGNVAPPGSHAAPLVFLVLDVQHDAAQHRPSRASQDHADADQPSSAHANQRAPSTSAAARHRLVPVFTNSSCRSFFKINDHADYVAVIKKLLKRDPLLTFALQKAVRHLKAGDAKPVNHVTPDPSGQSSSLCGLRLTPCVWRQDGQALPALMVEHNLPYDSEVVMPRLMRDYAVLSHVPAILTMIDFQGRVLYQNASSLEYLGDLLSVKHDANQAGLLQVLYMYDLGSLEEMLDHVLLGQEWQGVVQVPFSMRRHLGHQQDSTTIIDFLRTLGPPEGGARGTPDMDEEPGDNEQVHIGDAMSRIKKQHHRAASAFLMKQNGRQGDGARTSGADDSFASATGGERQSSVTSPAHDETPLPGVPGALQQRRFMSLIETKQQQQQQALAQQGTMVVGYEDDDGALAAEDSDPLGSDEAEPECYHEVHAIPLLDPVLDKQVIMLVQTDVTPRVELENKLADLTDAQLSMLEQLFPRHIIEYMLARVPSRVSRNLRDLANTHEKVMVLFCDVVGFTSMSKEVEASQVMHFLNELYEAFDNLVDDYGMYKLDIVGDCYIVVAGLIKEDQDGFVCVDELDDDQVAVNAVRIMQFAKAMLRESQPVVMPHNNAPVQLRIGIHTGPLVSGLVGSKMPKFTLFGDTMNTASRMESTCRHGCIHVSDAFARLLPHEEWESTGGVQVKGKGLMSTFLWSSANQRKDTLDQHAELNMRSLRQSGTVQGSFTSAKTRQSLRSGASKRGSEAGVGHGVAGITSNNPLMTILHNIRGGGEEDASSEAGAYAGMGGIGGVVAGSSGALRPKSGRARMPMGGKSHANLRLQRDSSIAGVSDREDRRGGGTGSDVNGTRRYKRTSDSHSQRTSPSMGTYYERPSAGTGEHRGRPSMEGMVSPVAGTYAHSHSQGVCSTGGTHVGRKSDSGLARIRDWSRSRELTISRDDVGDGALDDLLGLRLGLRELVAARRSSRQSSNGTSMRSQRGEQRQHGSRASSRSGISLGPAPASVSGRIGGGFGGPGAASSGGGALDDLDLDDSVLHLGPLTSPTSTSSTPGRRQAQASNPGIKPYKS